MDNRELLFNEEFINNDIDHISDTESSELSEEIEEEEKMITETRLLIMNSKDRDWMGANNIILDQKTFNYIVKFAPTTDQGNFFGQSKLAHFLTNFKDILSIEFTHFIVPDIYLELDTLHSLADTNNKIIVSNKGDSGKDSRNLKFKKLSHLPYISLVINEIGPNIEGTNSLLNTSTAIFTLDQKRLTYDNSGRKYVYQSDFNTYEHNNLGKNLIPESNKSILVFYNILPWKKLYSPNPKSTINLLNISFFDPDGKEIKLLDDVLNVESIGLSNTDESGEIVSYTYNNITIFAENKTTVSLPITSTPWGFSQSNITLNSDKYSTNNVGESPNIVISTSSDGLSITVSISGGKHFKENDVLKIRDPSNTSLDTLYFGIKNVTGNTISINTKTYFSPEEYNIGDRILFKNLSMTGNDFYDQNFLAKSQLENFINRESGHIIVGLGESQNTNNISRCNMFNQIQIAFNYNLDKTTGNSSISDTYELQKNVLGIVKGASSTTQINLGNIITVTSVLKNWDYPYNNMPVNINNYYDNKKLTFTSGDVLNQETTINSYSLDGSNLIANVDPLNISPSINDRFMINMSSKVTEGRLINLDLQNTMVLKITTEKKDDSILKY